MAEACPNRSMGCAFSRSSRPDGPLLPGNLRLPLTNVRADVVVQVQFLVAWAARPETEDEDEDQDSRVVSPSRTLSRESDTAGLRWGGQRTLRKGRASGDARVEHGVGRVD